MTNNPGSEERLRKELGALGARDYEMVALCMNPERGLAALLYAMERGVDYPIPYATKMFDNPDWNPKGETRRIVTNASVDRDCEACDGHRFVPVTAGFGPYEETWAPCASCNAKIDTGFWTADGRRHVTAAR